MGITVNHLPVLTWNQLKLNEAVLTADIAEMGRQQAPRGTELPAGIVREEHVAPDELKKRFASLGITNPKEKIVAGKVPMYNRQSFATGMGAELDRFMEETGTAAELYTVEGKLSADEPIMLSYAYAPGESGLIRTFLHAKAGSESTFVFCFSSGNSLYGSNFGERPAERASSGEAKRADCKARNGQQGEAKSDVSVPLVGAQTYVYLEEGAKVHLHVVQMLDRKYTFFHDIGGFSCKDSQLSLTKLDLGASAVYEGLSELQMGDRSDFSVDFGYVGLPGSSMDINYNDVFVGKKGNGRMYFKEALQGNATKTFRGTIDFRQDAKGSVGDEQEDILLLGEDVVNKTIPLILCEEENVDGRHAASIGSLSEDMLFYMETRGIDKRKAEELMVRASIEGISRRIPSEEIREAVTRYISGIFE